MKILYTISRYWPAIGGAELHTKELIRHLSKRHRAMVACLRNDSYRDEWLYGWTTRPPAKQKPYFDDKVEIRVIRLGLLRRVALRRKLTGYYSDPQHQTDCKKQLAGLFMKELMKINGSFDIVHNVLVGDEFFSLASLYLARKNRIPFVFTPVSHPDGWRGEIFSHIYRNADALIAMTEAEKDFIVSQGARDDNVFVAGAGPLITGCVPEGSIKDRLSIHGQAVLFMGQKIHYKGIGQTIEAAHLVWKKHPETVFIFAGPRTEHSKKLFTGRLDKRIIELGTVSEDEKVSLISGCDIFCMPSVCESFGMVYLEAWSFRKPVIAADTATGRCVIEDGHDGLLVKQDPSSIAGAVCKLIENTTLRMRLGENGYAKVTSLYSWPMVAAEVEAAYRHAVHRGGR